MFVLRRALRSNLRLHKTYSTSSKLIETTQDNETGIATISMARAPANCLNTELLDAVKTALTEAKKNSRGIILTSSLPHIFSAGLDVLEMYNTDKKRLFEFWSTLQQTWLTLYSSEVPIAAAINGASPAGGCLFAISCDYRVFVEGNHTMGLNETKLGLIAPKWFRDPYISVLGYRTAETSLLRGALYTPKDALNIGLVDDLAADKEQAINKCKKHLASFKNISPQAVGKTKLEMRKSLISWLKEHQEEDTNGFLQFVQAPQVQKGLKQYLELLKQK